MLCCRDHNDDYFDENDIDENYYLHFDLLQSSLLRNIDLKNIIDEIVFNTTEQFIRLKVFKEILKKYTLHSDKIIEILVSAFFILPTKNIINESYENYLKFNIQFIILNEIEFNKYIEFINKSTNFNSKNKEFIQDSKLNSMYIIFFLISFSEFNEINNVIKIKVIFSMLDGHSKKFIRRDENEVEEILTKYVEFCLFITDIVSNFFLESKSKKVATFKKQFIAYKTHLLFLKEFANLFDQFVEYIIDNLIFTKQQSNQKIYYNVNNLYNDSLEPSNIFGYIFKMNNYALFKPMEIRNRLTEFLKL